VLVVAAIALGVKVAFSRGRVSSKRSNGEVRGDRYSRSLHRPQASDVEDDLARLKRETGS
jgi:hypothetical protein